jgi:Ca2+-dependent lipid-binding protein
MRRYYHKKHRHNTHQYKHHTTPKKFNARRTFHKSNNFVQRHPIISAVISIVLSIILLRISFLFEKTEFRAWFIFFAILLGIIGIIAVIVWFRNNVSDLTTKHTVDWRRK